MAGLQRCRIISRLGGDRNQQTNESAGPIKAPHPLLVIASIHHTNVRPGLGGPNRFGPGVPC
jgi:hypothetical protein